MKRCRIIGLTGQSGAGKSTVAKRFEQNGFAVINADELVRKIYENDSPCLKNISAVFGEDVIKSDGSPDRKLLAQRAFSSKENTDMLNSIVHPFVMAKFLSEVENVVNNGVDTVVYDAPQLFESKSHIICDLVVSVVAHRQMRLERICQRDGISREMAEIRIDAQLSEDFFRKNSNYIIENNGSLEMLVKQTDMLLTEIR